MREKIANTDKLFYTFKTLAKELDISVKTIDSWRSKGLLVSQIERTKIIKVKNLLKFLNRYEI